MFSNGDPAIELYVYNGQITSSPKKITKVVHKTFMNVYCSYPPDVSGRDAGQVSGLS